MSDLKRTPLHPFNAQYSPKFVPFAGWEMPVSFTSILEEHLAVREKAGFFDVSHMGEVLVSGPDTEAFLNSIITNNLSRIEPGQAIYSLLCMPDGGVVDDIILYQISKEEYFICLNASNAKKDIEWMQSHLLDYDCKVKNVSDQYAQIAIQGPRAESILMELIEEVSSIKRFHFKKVHFEGGEILISRTGYTGEDGFELYIPSSIADKVANTVYDFGKENGLKLCGLGARDSLRLEAGFPLYGHEISETISPITAGLNWAVRFKKSADFIGRIALLKEREKGPNQRVVFFKLEGRRISREGATIVSNHKIVGKVLSGSFSPVLSSPIGSALINSDVLKEKKALAVELREKQFPLILVSPPMHK